MNKKALSLLAVVALGSFAGCGNTNTSTSSTSSSTPAPAKKYSVGLGYEASFQTKGQLDVTTAFAAFDEEGKVYDVRFDVVQVKFAATEAKDGLALTNTNVVDNSVTTKLELGLGYNMQASSFIGKEVDEQIEAFADYCAGKTVAEVIASTVNPGHSSDGTPVCDELTGKVTISVDGFEAALQNAFDTKTEATYELTGTAGVAMVSGLAYNYGNPTKEIDVTAAGAFVKDGKIEAALFDPIITPVAIAEDGTLALDTASKYVVDGKVASKKTLGDAYAMRPASPIGAEWDEQALVIEAAAAGKTAAEVTALVAGEGELAGATMTVTTYLKAIAKAATYAEKAMISAR